MGVHVTPTNHTTSRTSHIKNINYLEDMDGNANNVKQGIVTLCWGRVFRVDTLVLPQWKMYRMYSTGRRQNSTNLFVFNGTIQIIARKIDACQSIHNRSLQGVSTMYMSVVLTSPPFDPHLIAVNLPSPGKFHPLPPNRILQCSLGPPKMTFHETCPLYH